MLMLRPRRTSCRDRALAHLRVHGPWLIRDVLRAVLLLALGAVSAYYLTRWALMLAWPAGLGWTLPVALDAAGLLALVVLRHPRDRTARRRALELALGAAALSVLGNSAAHAADHGWLNLTDPTVALVAAVVTGAVYPAVLVWGAHVSAGMAPRPTAGTENPSPLPAPAPRRARRDATPPPPSAADAEGGGIAVSAVVAPDRERLIAWALAHPQPSGAPAGKKAIRSAHPGVTDHAARTAAAEARRRAPAGVAA